MKLMNRRRFLRNSVAGMALGGSLGLAKSVDARVEVFLDESNGIIAPEIYGHFTEHIGGVIYDGVWVGEDSKIPNQFGIRKELLDRMNQIHVPILRWPGGCFADSYDWKDGIGPRKQRPRRTNFWETNRDADRLNGKGPQVTEPNYFGTNEFIRFCELTKAEPYIAVNLRSQTALDFDHWVEYCNSPTGSTTLAEMRRDAGFADPFRVKYWGVGNESWGCGGNFLPEEYASEFRRFTDWIPKFGVGLQLIAAGPNGNDIDWTHRFFEQIFTAGRTYRNQSFTGWSIHHYASNLSRGKTQDFNLGKGEALKFDQVDWYELMRESHRVEKIITDQWSVMSQYDPGHRIKLVVDEYGPWYREGTEVDISHIFGQQITVRDALATALTLDAFNRHCEKISIATCAQLVNNLNALFLCHEDKFLVTPNFYVFEMYAAHQGAQSLRTEFAAPNIHFQRDNQDATFWGLNGSASRKGKTVTLTMVNPSLQASAETQITIRGGSASRATGIVLAAADMHAHNTFEEPSAVKSASLAVRISEGTVIVTIPQGSVTKLAIEIT